MLVLWAFLGLESASVAAGHVDNPQRNVPLATIGGVLLAAVIYIAASTALLGILPADSLAKSTAPFADATTVIFGSTAGALVASCAALKASGTLTGWLLLTAQSGTACSKLDQPSNEAFTPPSLRQFLVPGVLMSFVVVAISDASVAAQFSKLANAVVMVMLCFYAIAGTALMTAPPLANSGFGRASRWLGAAGATVAISIIAIQDRLTISVTASIVLGCGLVRFLMVARRSDAAGG